jgi:dolichol-phosphate mannosyltransferase
MNVTVTLPAHNEATTIADVIQRVRNFVPDAYIIVACDRCNDGTGTVARARGADEVLQSPGHGLARVFEFEMEKALATKPDVIVHIDADGQYDPQDIPLLVRGIVAGHDMVMGNRLHTRPEGMSASKYLNNRLGSFTYSTLLHNQIPDITTGFRALTPGVARLGISLKSKFTYTQELTWRTYKAGYRVSYVPVSFYPRADGSSRLMQGCWHYITRSAKDFRRFAL